MEVSSHDFFCNRSCSFIKRQPPHWMNRVFGFWVSKRFRIRVAAQVNVAYWRFTAIQTTQKPHCCDVVTNVLPRIFNDSSSLIAGSEAITSVTSKLSHDCAPVSVKVSQAGLLSWAILHSYCWLCLSRTWGQKWRTLLSPFRSSRWSWTNWLGMKVWTRPGRSMRSSSRCWSSPERTKRGWCPNAGSWMQRSCPRPQKLQTRWKWDRRMKRRWTF